MYLSSIEQYTFQLQIRLHTVHQLYKVQQLGMSALLGLLLALYFVLYGLSRFIIQWYRPNYDNNNQSGWNSGHTVFGLIKDIALVILGK